MIKEPQQVRLSTTLYKLDGLRDTVFRFRVLKVRERVPRDNYLPIRMQHWADLLWRRELRCPVYPTSASGWPAFLVPEREGSRVNRVIEIEDVPQMVYHVEVTDEVREVSLDSASEVERELVCRMLERAFTERLKVRRDEFWMDHRTLFFRMTAENAGNPKDTVNAYRGFKFGVVVLEGGVLSLAVDVKTRYIGRRSLADYTEHEKQTILRQHLDTNTDPGSRRFLVRDNGSVKIPCRYSGETGKPIDECTFDDTGKTVYQYYRERYPGIAVEPREAAVFVQDRRSECNSIPVPVSRLFPVFTTDYEGLRECSTRPQLSPQQRAESISRFLRQVMRVTYEGGEISVEPRPITRERTAFIPPRLEFGKNRIIAPFAEGNVPPVWSRELDDAVVKWSSMKLPTLYESGPYHNEPPPELALLYPDNIERSLRDRFLEVLSEELSRQSGQQYHIRLKRSYSTGSQEQMGTSLLGWAPTLKAMNTRLLAIVVLWNGLDSRVYGELKQALKPVLSQCVTERVMRSIVDRSGTAHARSQLTHLALGVLTECGTKPWVIADPLHHDLHIGIDVLYGKAGYHFLYGQGGRLVSREFGEAMGRGRMREAIKRPEMFRRIEQSVRSIVQKGGSVRSIVVHRDGRWWPSESDGLHEAMQCLKKDGVLPQDVRYAVVEIRKNHMPVRLFDSVRVKQVRLLQNPLPGTYFIIDRHRALLVTTGGPRGWENPRGGRTAGTLLLRIAEPSDGVDICQIAEDAYRLTQLNWNAPNIGIALPVTIRWTDHALRETAGFRGEE